MSYNPYFEGTLSQYDSNYGATGTLPFNEDNITLNSVYLYVPDFTIQQATYLTSFEIPLPTGFNKDIHRTKCRVLKGSFLKDYATIGGTEFRNNVKTTSQMGAITVVWFDTDVTTYLDSLTNPTKAKVDATFYDDPDSGGVSCAHYGLKFMFYWEAKV